MLIEKHIPDCRVAIGHGQMKPEDLEKIIMGFINYDYDVLLSTTIVENGIDISNANTIIVSDAHASDAWTRRKKQQEGFLLSDGAT